MNLECYPRFHAAAGDAAQAPVADNGMVVSMETEPTAATLIENATGAEGTTLVQTAETADPAQQPPEPAPEPTELQKYWKAVKENPSDFTGWTYLLQFVEQEVTNNTAHMVVFLKQLPWQLFHWWLLPYSWYEKTTITGSRWCCPL